MVKFAAVFGYAFLVMVVGAIPFIGGVILVNHTGNWLWLVAGTIGAVVNQWPLIKRVDRVMDWAVR